MPLLSGIEVGELIGIAPAYAVDQDRIDRFAEVTGDLQWIHVDTERAASGPYGGTVAHGYLVLSLLPAFTRSVVDLSAGGTVINYGLNRVRFIGPARAGAPLVDRITLAGLAEKPGGLLIELSHEIVEERSGAMICQARTLTLLRPPEATAAS